MTAIVAALREGGPWVALIVVVVAGVIGLTFAMSRGILVRGGEVDRIERRIEKDTDRVLALYVEQIRTLTAASAKKDETIAAQAAQIERLLAGSEVSTEALSKIIKEAERRGFLA